MIIVLAALTGIVFVASIVAPFFLGKGGVLAETSSIQSKERLNALKHSLLLRYLDEEAGARRRDFSDRTWRKRQEFLINRYVDAARRLDFLEGPAKSELKAPGLSKK